MTYLREASGHDGPWMDLTEEHLIVWTTKEMYGRVHHVTGDLNEIEKLLTKARQFQMDALRDLNMMFTPGEVVVDGMKGGRNKMVVYYSIRASGGKWTEEQQEALLKVIGTKYTRGFKDLPSF